MAFDLDNEELEATKKLNGIYYKDKIYENRDKIKQNKIKKAKLEKELSNLYYIRDCVWDNPGEIVKIKITTNFFSIFNELFSEKNKFSVDKYTLSRIIDALIDEKELDLGHELKERDLKNLKKEKGNQK